MEEEDERTGSCEMTSSSRPVGPAPTSTNTDIPSLLELVARLRESADPQWAPTSSDVQIMRGLMIEAADTLSRLSGNGGRYVEPLQPSASLEEGRDLVNSVIVDACWKAMEDYSDNKTTYRQDLRHGLSVVAPMIVARALKAPAASERLP